ncbi:MAG: squalene--hopene cyclase [Planctomycetes bacterium]|nr:squalene--hopene cyclase [Planctomycetota bacterium]
MGIDPKRVEKAYYSAREILLKSRLPGGWWEGELSSSALSTAVAVSALIAAKIEAPKLVENGLFWLKNHQNEDGGWGDTTISFSNISTTLLVKSAFYISGKSQEFSSTLEKADQWLASRYGSSGKELAEALRQRYGKDHTFSVPILTTCALAGLVDWDEVPALPFELACLPQSLYRFMGLPVVSYALPALIAIGICIHHCNPSAIPPLRLLRNACTSRALKVLKNIQPANGGFLEATPLTAFVTLSLSATGRENHDVVKKGVAFILNSVRPDGSWPIDTNLSTWVTTLSINALASADDLECLGQTDSLVEWIKGQQYETIHPYTGAEPGGWGWTPLPGCVPDADDTPGALLALTNLKEKPAEWLRAGVRWLSGLQNTDSGIPTFCHGWSNLPFDRSGCDLTAHMLRAIAPWYPEGGTDNIDPALHSVEVELEKLYDGGLTYLRENQNGDGSWLPLWFGNQHEESETNPVYGTCRVLAAFRDLGLWEELHARKGVRFLEKAQNDDGGWGGSYGCPSSVEESSLALEILWDMDSDPKVLEKGLLWLINALENDQILKVAPIGFYFAKLWYFEKLYPIIFAVGALGRIRKSMMV